MRIPLPATALICLLCAACAVPGPAQRSPLDTDDAPPQQAPESAASSAPTIGTDLVIAAMTYLDRPYRMGGHSADTGFDCSGFTRHVFGQVLGLELPRSAEEQALAPMLQTVSSRSALQAGDLVFFDTQHRAFSHVGIYLGDGRFIHAPRTGAHVRIERLSTSYWSSRYTGARRALVAQATP
jgi:cell wall-associated NlpC family hydrolase